MIVIISDSSDVEALYVTVYQFSYWP